MPVSVDKLPLAVAARNRLAHTLSIRRSQGTFEMYPPSM